MNKKNILIFVSIIIITGAIIVANLLFERPTEVPIDNETTRETSSEQVLDDEEFFSNRGKASDIEKSSYTGRPLDEVRFGENFNAPQEAIDLQKQRLKELIELTEKNPDSIDAWIGIGLVKKFFNDYEGARDVWEYTAHKFPFYPITFSNLASLYGYYLGDKDRAIMNYEYAVNISPWEPGYYLALAQFYGDVEQNSDKVVEVIKEGMENAPQDVNLPLFLASYYKSLGDNDNAIKYYEKVLELSPDFPGVQDEINALK